MIDTSHQSLEEMHWFDAIFKIFGRAIFEVIIKETEGDWKKIKPPTYEELFGLNASPKYFENSINLMHSFQRLMGSVDRR